MGKQADRRVLGTSSVLATRTGPALLRRASQFRPVEMPASVERTLRTPGAPLEPAPRAFMEARFGHDFGQVRVHVDTPAAESATDVHAHAYTVGQNIVFGPGQYAPHSDAGQRLLAHELTHVLQQGGGSASRCSQASALSVSDPADAAEQEADRIADAVVVGAQDDTIEVTSTVRGDAGPQIMRQLDPDGARRRDPDGLDEPLPQQDIDSLPQAGGLPAPLAAWKLAYPWEIGQPTVSTCWAAAILSWMKSAGIDTPHDRPEDLVAAYKGKRRANGDPYLTSDGSLVINKWEHIIEEQTKMRCNSTYLDSMTLKFDVILSKLMASDRAYIVAGEVRSASWKHAYVIYGVDAREPKKPPQMLVMDPDGGRLKSWPIPPSQGLFVLTTMP